MLPPPATPRSASEGSPYRWSRATAYNRGQVIYRVAEMLEGRRDQFAAEVAAAEGRSTADALELVDASIDRVVWYAGWAEKFAQVAGSANPIGGQTAAIKCWGRSVDEMVMRSPPG